VDDPLQFWEQPQPFTPAYRSVPTTPPHLFDLQRQRAIFQGVTATF
jgi:hypothetical protein